MKNAVVLTAKNQFSERFDTWDLDGLNEAVGGFIEIVDLNDNYAMIVNEEGKLLNLPVNGVASLMFIAMTGNTDVIVGDVVFMRKDKPGELTSLTLKQFFDDFDDFFTHFDISGIGEDDGV